VSLFSPFGEFIVNPIDRLGKSFLSTPPSAPPSKARAAIAWCEAASTPDCRWEYLYVPQGVFERLSGDTLGALARTCQPALKTLIDSEHTSDQLPLFAAAALAAAFTALFQSPS
jgi:hypothetical protein